MLNVAEASINTFGTTSPKVDFVPPEDPILEIPASELQGLLNELVLTYNQIAETVRDAGILRGRELAKTVARASDSLEATGSPIEKLQLINAYMRQLLTKIRDALKARPPAEGSKLIQVCTKIQARAIQIIDYIKTYGDDHSRGKNISLDSQQTRLLFSGKTGEPVSRRDTIRAMKRAEKIWPALKCDHRPNDGRRTMRLTARVEDLQGLAPEFTYCDSRQRSSLDDIRIMFNLA